MAVAGSVLWTVLIRLSVTGELIVVRREQAHARACFDGSIDEITDRLINGETLRLTERRYQEYQKAGES